MFFPIQPSWQAAIRLPAGLPTAENALRRPMAYPARGWGIVAGAIGPGRRFEPTDLGRIS
jgi:hypothetical protein